MITVIVEFPFARCGRGSLGVLDSDRQICTFETDAVGLVSSLVLALEE